MSIFKKTKLLLFISLACSIVACSDSGGGGGEPDEAIVIVASARDNFDFTIEPTLNAGFSENFQAYLESKLGSSVEALNRMPNIFNDYTIPVTYQSCDEPNAYYNGYYRSITLCHELANDAYRLFLNNDKSNQTTARDNAYSTVIFALYHEIGHALEDIRNLGTGGDYESVADGIGVVLSAQTMQHSAPFYAGKYFGQNAASSYYDEHGSGEDRAGNLTCWIIGSSSRISAQLPLTTANFVRAGRDCVSEYAGQYQYVFGLLPNIGDVVPVGTVNQRSNQRTPIELTAEQAAELDAIGVSIKSR